MAYPKGKSRPENSGRRAGTPNKRRSILEVCESLSFDPFEEMARMASSKEHDRQFDALKELCQYVEPKKKALEVSGSLSPDMAAMAEQFASMSKEELIKIIQNELKVTK